MAKLTLSNLANLSNEASAVTTINNNSDAIETAIENTLSRDGTSPNSMGADLDLNGYDLINVGNLLIDGDIIEADTVTGFVDWDEIAAPVNPSANTARMYAVDESGVTTLSMKDSAGNVVPMSHFKPTGTGVVARTMHSKNSDTISVTDFGADSTGANDSAAAIQAAIDFAASVTTARSTIHIPSTWLGNSYKINSALTWKPNVNIVCDPQVRIFAGAAMDAMLQTGVGSSGVRLRNVFLQGGRWDGDYLARRGFWIKDGNGVHLNSFLIRSIGAYTDGVTETESSYIRIGDPSQFTTCYEIMIDDFGLWRTDDAAVPTPAPANNYGIYSGNDSSDNHIHNGIIFGTKKGISGNLAGWKTDKVHFWDFPATTGVMTNAIESTTYGCALSNIQVDCTTAHVPLSLNGSGVAYILNNILISCVDGTDNTGKAIELGSGVIVSASGLRIECDASHRYANDLTGDTNNFTAYGTVNVNVVTPNIRATHIVDSVNSDFAQLVKNVNTGASATAGWQLQTDAGTASLLARAIAAFPSFSMSWDGAEGVFVSATHAGGKIRLQTGGANTRLTVDENGAVTASAPLGGLGYGAGAGGTVTQATSKSTGVTLNKVCGQITMHNATLNAGAEVGFTVSNSAVAATDVIVPNISGGASFDSYHIGIDDVSAGSFRITLTNVSAGNLGEAVEINFAVIRVVAA
jgi:hypothetical protein